MEPILRSCAGLDVHKKEIKACIAYGDFDKLPCYKIRTFSTMSSGLRKLNAWLKEYEVTAVVMESTGVYWKPLFNILEGDFDVILANPYHIKNVPGRKTDVKDSQWLAMLLRNGLAPRSFVPPREIRELRDLTRTRKKLRDNMTAEKNRIQKVLEDANIKLKSVVSKIDGVSSMRIIHALLEKDELSKEEIAEMTSGKLRSKVDQLVEALDGKITEHHRFLLKMHLENIEFLAQQVQKLDEEIQKRMVPFQFEYRIIQTIPGISEVSAATIIAEIGTDMSQFLMRHIYPRGQGYLLEITRALGLKRAAERVKATNSSKLRSLRLPGQHRKSKILPTAPSSTTSLNAEGRNVRWSPWLIAY